MSWNKARAINILAGLGVVGDVAAITALGLWCVDSATTSALTTLHLADLLPGVFLGFLGGAVLDRFKKPSIWVAGLLIQVVLYVALAMRFDFAMAVTVTVASSIVSVLYGSAAFVYSQELAGPTDAPRAAKYNMVCCTVGSVLGFGVVAACYEPLGIEKMMLVNAATFALLAAGAAMLLRSHGDNAHSDGTEADTATNPEADSPTSAENSSATTLVGAFSLVGLSTIVAVIFGTSLESVAGMFVLRDRIGMPPWQVAAASGVWTVMIVAASAMVPSTVGNTKGGRLALLGLSAAISGVGIGLVGALLPPAIVVAALYALGGCGNGAFNTVMMVGISRGVAATHQGRAAGTFRSVTSAALVTGILAGGLVSLLSPRTAVVLAGTLPLAVGIIAMTYARCKVQSQHA